MMRKTITRTIPKSTVTAYHMVKVDGRPTVEMLDPITAWGKLTAKEARRLLADAYGKDCNAMIDEITVVGETYQIDIDTFIKNAVKVEQTQVPFDECADSDSID